MKRSQLADIHWLLLCSKENMRYAEQCKEWNRIMREWRTMNTLLVNPLPDLLRNPLTELGVYQD